MSKKFVYTRNRKASSLEKAIRQLLIDNNIKYKREFRIETFPVDFYLPQYHLTIQVDGAYWHEPCNKCKVTGAKYHESSFFQRQKDLSCIAVHIYKRINIIRLCECEVEEAAFLKILKKAIKEITNGKNYYRDREM